MAKGPKKKKRGKKKPKRLALPPGTYRCYLCGFVTEEVQDLQDHLIRDHELTLREYKKLYPSGAKPFDLTGRLMTAEQLYQATIFRATHGRWPDWYDGQKVMDVANADPALLRVFATVLINHYMHKLGPMMLYATQAGDLVYDTRNLSKESLEATTEKLNNANRTIRETARAFTDLVTTLDKSKSVLPVRGRFVAAGEIGEKTGVLQHEATAQLSEIGDLVGGFLREGPEGLPVPPSQYETKSEKEDKGG